MNPKRQSRTLTARQREGRAINAVAELLRRTLSVPNIYLEPPQTIILADVLAVDRGGAGDLHAVEVKLAPDLRPEIPEPAPSNPKALNEMYRTWHSKYRQKLQSIHRQLMAMPAHYRYLAIPADSFDLALGELAHLGLFAKNGIGRLGIITIKDKGEASPAAELVVAPERFRVEAASLKTIEARLLAKCRPDIEVRI